MTQHYFDEKFSTKGPVNYERYFVPVIGKPLAIDLVDKAGLQSGNSVLDVACGTGIVARLASQKIGKSGFIAGLDPNPGMLAVARSLKLETVAEWYEANAEAMPLADNTFDFVFCQMGLQFMEDKVIALKEMNRVLNSEGILYLNLPGPIAGLFNSLALAMKKHIGSKAEGFVRHVFSLFDENDIEQLFKNAGFKNINISVNTKTLELPGAADFMWQYIYSTPLAAVTADAGKESLDNLEKEVTEKWQDYRKNGSIIYDQPMVSIVAKK